MVHRKRFMRGGRSVRETLWFSMTETRTTLAAANTAAIILSLNAAALALRPFTIVRSLMFFHVRSDQGAATENYDVALGGAVVSDQAVAIGVTAVPTPFTDLGLDLWFLHQILSGHLEVTTDIGRIANNNLWRQVESKAMRKVEDGQDLIFTLENSSLSDGSTSFVAGRLLIKLH